MQIEILNNFTGDNKIEIDTDTEEGRNKLVETFMGLMKAGTAIFLERADKTYRVTGYDPQTDSLRVDVPVQPETSQALSVRKERFPCKCTKCTNCTNTYAKSRYGICSPCQQGKHGGEKTTVKARPRRSDRVTAVAPRAGG